MFRRARPDDPGPPARTLAYQEFFERLATPPSIAVRASLPLEIREVRYADPVLRLGGTDPTGTDWWLELRCAWRVTTSDREFSWESDGVVRDVAVLVGRRIIAVSSAEDVIVDPVFDLGGGLHLIVRADTPRSPWRMWVRGVLIRGAMGAGPPSASGPYRRFRHSFLDHVRRDGAELGLLDELGPDDRARAERELLARIADSPDAVAGLAYLRSGAAIEPLRALLRSGRGSMAIHAAAALWDLVEDAEALGVLCWTVERRPLLGRPLRRVHAAAALARIPRREALATLIGALDDRTGAVGGHAMTAVAQRLRLDVQVDAWRSGHLTLAELRATAWAVLGAEPGTSDSR